LQRTQPGIILL